METNTPHIIRDWVELDAVPVSDRRVGDRHTPQTLIPYLEEHPDQWVAFSMHRTRNAARQRILRLRVSQTWHRQPLRFRTAKQTLLDPTSPIVVLVQYDPECTETSEAPEAS